jgi:hypothetical protein
MGEYGSAEENILALRPPVAAAALTGVGRCGVAAAAEYESPAASAVAAKTAVPARIAHRRVWPNVPMLILSTVNGGERSLLA